MAWQEPARGRGGAQVGGAARGDGGSGAEAQGTRALLAVWCARGVGCRRASRRCAPWGRRRSAPLPACLLAEPGVLCPVLVSFVQTHLFSGGGCALTRFCTRWRARPPVPRPPAELCSARPAVLAQKACPARRPRVNVLEQQGMQQAAPVSVCCPEKDSGPVPAASNCKKRLPQNAGAHSVLGTLNCNAAARASASLAHRGVSARTHCGQPHTMPHAVRASTSGPCLSRPRRHGDDRTRLTRCVAARGAWRRPARGCGRWPLRGLPAFGNPSTAANTTRTAVSGCERSQPVRDGAQWGQAPRRRVTHRSQRA